MSFSSRRRNYLLTPHRRDGLIEWMKSMLMHSFVLDALETTGADTFSHFELLIQEHLELTGPGAGNGTNNNNRDAASTSGSSHTQISRLKQLVPTVGTFHTPLPLRKAFEVYNEKHGLTKRKHITISFNEIRHILNLAQIMALAGIASGGGGGMINTSTNMTTTNAGSQTLTTTTKTTNNTDTTPSNDDTNKNAANANDNDDDSDGPMFPADASTTTTYSNDNDNDNDTNIFVGPRLITFDGDQTLYSDGANFESNRPLAHYLYLLLTHGVTVAVVTAAGYEYMTERYEHRLSGLLNYFQQQQLSAEDCSRFYLFGGECNYLLQLGSDYRLHAVKETGPGGWITSTLYLEEAPGNWNDADIQQLLHVAKQSLSATKDELKMRSRVITKKRSVGLIPMTDSYMPRECLDEAVLRVQGELASSIQSTIPFCAFNGGRDVWVDVGNKRVGVQILQSYTGIGHSQTLHIGDQFLNTGNDYAARDVCPCIWITSPEETTYILKSILRLANIGAHQLSPAAAAPPPPPASSLSSSMTKTSSDLDFTELERRTAAVKKMNVFTGEMVDLPTA